MKLVITDGGRAEAGFKGTTRDCVTRSIAIVTGKPYKEVYDALNEIAKSERTGKRKTKKSNARTGVFRYTYDRYLKSLGYEWTATMMIGEGCRVHLRAEELPTGRLIVKTSRHLTAVIDGVIHDTHDPSRDGTRCVYGYYSKGLPKNDPRLKIGDIYDLLTYSPNVWRHVIYTGLIQDETFTTREVHAFKTANGTYLVERDDLPNRVAIRLARRYPYLATGKAPFDKKMPVLSLNFETREVIVTYLGNDLLKKFDELQLYRYDPETFDYLPVKLVR